MMRDVILDSNIFILFLAGQINENKIERYTRNSLYTREDYYFLLNILADYDQIITSPNILTEVDNILNRITGEDKYKYLVLVKAIYKQTIEKYIRTETVAQNWFFDALGITDSSILMMAKDCGLLISGDSSLCDYAKSLNIKTFDFKEYLNKKL
jgi:predicted nucleic acid-binding protein